MYGTLPSDPGDQAKFKMDNATSETKFDGLVSAVELSLESNQLTRVPSLKNMGKLKALLLGSNHITRIEKGSVGHSSVQARWHPGWHAHGADAVALCC